MTSIPLNKLTPAKTNVRKTGTGDGIDALAASIAAHGLLASLVVRKAGRGKFAVIAGQRRYRALLALARADKIADDLPVSCHVIGEDEDATEIGLAENVVRIAMHPADQFEAFRELMDKGATAGEVAARFGVSESTVAKRMRLGRVSARILNAYRAGELGLEQVQAFTLSDDAAEQERVFSAMPDASPYSIRRALTEGEIPASDRRARFVGLETYEAAGGQVRRDLFDDDNSGFLLDAALLERLVAEKLEAEAETVRAEGWSWVELLRDFGYAERIRFRQLEPVEVALSDEEAAERDALQTEHDALLDRLDEDDESPEADERLAQLEARLEVLDALTLHWSEESRAAGGAVLSLAADGTIEVHRGLALPAKQEQEEGAERSTADLPDGRSAGLPTTLTADLTAQRTAALRTVLAQTPDIALAAVTHALARQAFYDDSPASCLGIALKGRRLGDAILQADGCTGLSGFDAQRRCWTERLPADGGDLFAWCLAQLPETLLALLAVSAAHGLDAVRDKAMREDAPALVHADALADALSFDMHCWFTPNAANYFGRITRVQIMEAMVEAGVPARTRSWSKLSKAELAALAERETLGTGWLPHLLRGTAGATVPDEALTSMPVLAAA